MKFTKLEIKNTHGLTPQILRRLEKEQTNASNRTKIMAIRLVMEGKKVIETASILNIHRESVGSYVKKFEAGGIDGLLKRGFSSGKPTYLTDDKQLELVEIILNSTPKQLELGTESFWNTKIIQHLLTTKYKIEMTRGGVCKMLARLGLSYTNSTYVLSKANQEKQEAFLLELNDVKKTL